MKWPLRRQIEQQNQDSIRKWVDPIYAFSPKGPFGPLTVLGKKPSSSAASAIDSLPVPTPQPPITPANAQVVQAEQDFAKASLLKKSVKRTILAGDTGGFRPGEAGYPGNPGPGPSTYKR